MEKEREEVLLSIRNQGSLLDHEHWGLKHGIVMAIGGVVLFSMGLIFEAQRERKNRKGPKC